MTQALFEAIRAGDAQAVDRVATPETVNATGPEGLRPLMLAATLGHLEIVSKLLALGAAVNAVDDRSFTPLFYGCYNSDEDRGHPDVVDLLLAAGANKEAQLGFGVRPLMYAAGNGEAGVVEVLLRAGANPLARNEVGRTALMMVTDRDYVDVINLLHEAETLLGTGGCGSRNAQQTQVVSFIKPVRNA